MIGIRHAHEAVTATRGLGRLVEPDGSMIEPRLHAWSKALVCGEDRAVSVSWVRGVAQGLHSVTVAYTPDAVRIGTRLGTRPGFWGMSGHVVLRMVVEHAVVRLREPLRGRRIEVMTDPV